MRPFDVQVSIIEPGATRTPIVEHEMLTARLRDLWNRLSLERQKEYGEEYLEAGKPLLTVINSCRSTSCYYLNQRLEAAGRDA